MPIHIDAPVPGVVFDPAAFRVRGWLWLEDKHAEIAAVEAHDRAILLGELGAAEFRERADVCAKYGLPAGTRTGFEFPARHPSAAPHEAARRLAHPAVVRAAARGAATGAAPVSNAVREGGRGRARL